MSRGDGPVEDYLDELLSQLRLPPRETRRLLAETEDHLREAADRAQRAGMSAPDAEREAVRAFGPPARLAAAARAARRPRPDQVLATVLWSLSALAGVGMLAVGVSGLLAALFNAVAGSKFVGALPQTYGAATCHYYLSMHPGAGSCSRAAMWENSQDAVSLRVAAGVLGLVILAVAWWTRRYLEHDVSVQRLRDGAVSAIAAVTFLVAGVGLTGWAVDIGVRYGSGGVGWYLSGGLVALAAGLGTAVVCWRSLRTLRPWAGLTAA